jgi:TPR repeat protein
MAIYILTSTETILEVSARPQESHLGDSAAKGLLSLQLKQQLTSSSFEEQQGYLSTAATAAYVSFNKLDQRHRYRASINLNPINGDSFNFVQGSTSSGFGYALALFQAWWETVLHKTDSFNNPVFATGEVLPSGQVNSIGHLNKKIDSLCRYVENNRSSIDSFCFCYPSSNDNEISIEDRTRIQMLGGVLYPVARLQKVLGSLLGDAYNGDPLGRWQPFKGLKSFNYEDSVRFFGRVKDTDRLYDDLQQNNGLLIVSGPSGAGKSSLIKAGLIPKLEKHNQNLHWAYTTPSDISSSGVLDFVLRQFIIAWSLASKGISLDDLERAFEQSIERGVALLASHITQESPRCLLYFDQYEEVFSQADQSIENITQNLKLIDELSKKIENLDIVLALRNEYLGRLLDNQAFRSPIISNVTSQLSSNSWYDIVHEQAAFSGIEFDRDDKEQTLDSIIIEEALQTPFALPMVEFLLEQLHLNAIDKSNGQKILSFSDYETLGGLSGAIAYRASEVLSKSDFSEQVNKLFSNFVGLNSDHLPFGKQVFLSEVEVDDPEFYGLIQDFINANIIVSYRNSANEPVAKLAHDSLFEYWDTLKQWVGTYTDYLTWRYSIDGQYIQWKKNKYKVGSGKYLITDKRLLKEGHSYNKIKSINESTIVEYVSLSLKQSRKILARYVSVILIPLLFLSLYLFDDLRIKSYYYSSIGEKWSVPFGIDALSEDEVRHREFSYRLDYQGGDLIKLTTQNGFGTPVVNISRENAASWQYKYTDKNKLLSSRSFNTVGSVMKVTNYEFSGDTAIASFNHRFGKIKLNRISNNTKLMPIGNKFHNEILFSTSSDISSNYIVYDKFGYTEKIFFQNPYGANVSNNNENYGIEYTYYENGKISSEYSINSLGKKYSNSRSPLIEYIYNEEGDFTNQKMIYPGRVVSTEYKYDERGNVAELREIDGHKTIIKIRNIDEYGNLIKVSTYNGNGARIMGEYGVAVAEMIYDNRGRIIVVSYFGSDLKPIMFKNTYAKVMMSLNERGNIISWLNFDVDGNVIVGELGCEIFLIDYDKNNNHIKRSCYRYDGDYKLDDEGVSKYVYTYDEFGSRIETKLYGLDGLAVTNTKGYSSIAFKYDENGNLINESYYDLNGRGSPLPSGIATFSSKYDFKGNLIEETYKDRDGKYISPNGYYKYIRKYDNLGRHTETAYLDFDGKPVMSTRAGFSREVTVYAQGKGFIESKNYYDDQGDLVFLNYGNKANTGSIKKLKSINSFTLNITSSPTNSLVFIDNSYVGNTPLIKNIQLGTYEIKIVKSGYSSDKSTVYSSIINNVEKDIVLVKEPDLDLLDILNRAESGDSEAQNEVGNLYLDGYVVEKNVDKAIMWYKKSAIQSNPEAIYNIGHLYHSGIYIKKDKKEAFFWFEISAKLGSSWAQSMVGVYYNEGWIVEKNNDLSFQYFLNSAKQGHARSALKIAFMYEYGSGVEKSVLKSTHWYKLAAQLGNEDAYLFLGDAYLEGQGIEQDAAKAMYWFNKAAKSKSVLSKGAYERLGSMYNRAQGIPNNYVKAVEYYEKAVFADYFSSAFDLALLVLQGKGTSVDVDKSIELFKQAEKNGNTQAKEYLIRIGYN